jgi:hypothetical protein
VQTRLALLPSPFLGPAAWAPVADLLRRRGWPTAVVAADDVSTPDDVLEGFLAGLPAESAHVLVPHSNAGLYVPLLCEHRTVVANVFVDAALPPAQGSAPLAPAALYDVLRDRAGPDGRLPPWTRWWDDAATEALFPSQEVRRRVEAEQARVPLSYLGARIDVPPRWLDVPGAYVAFGDTYAEERRQSEERGWPVTTLAGRHLHMLVEPDEVARSVAEALARLGVAGGR